MKSCEERQRFKDYWRRNIEFDFNNKCSVSQKTRNEEIFSTVFKGEWEGGGSIVKLQRRLYFKFC